MPTTLGSIRRLVLTPRLSEVSFAGRGFPVEPSPATRRLEAVPQAVICGFEWGVDSRDQWELERRLALVDPEQRGFAYEGATMACTVLDATAGGTRTRDLLLGEGQPHIFLAYIGIGFAMSKLPRVLWKKVLPDLGGTPYHPVMSWLAVDGYGFDLAYFHTRRWVDEQRIPAPYPWQGAPEYFPRAVDQGIGRALWFIHGGRPDRVAAAVDRFVPQRRADLWSGVGLAATFAGGCEPDGAAVLLDAAGQLWPELALGSVFAVRARTYSGHLPSYSEAISLGLTGRSVADLLELAEGTAVTVTAPGEVPPYERWRQNIRSSFRTAERLLPSGG